MTNRIAAILLLTVVGLTLGARGASLPAGAVEQAKFFEDQVLPILKNQCFSCHGGEAKIKGGLNLTSREGLLKGGDTGPAFDPDRADKSLLLQAVSYVNDDLQMPPKAKLPQSQLEVLNKWVAMGAPWSAKVSGTAVKHGPPQVDDEARRFWSFQPVSHPAPPAVKDAGWVKTAVDAFVLAKLESNGLKPAGDAEKAALIRRLYYDLTGLPPAPAEVEAFVKDPSPNAYEQVVDRLLASPHYGEHWGRHWLDLVRYAETNSFERDSAKPNAWRYRDYVIDAFNSDKPYDRFVREQIAGDELEPVTPQGIIATGFYRLGIWDDEPADREQARYDELDDIVTVTGQTFLGLTVNCARCHDHKIDPFPQKDYYRLVSFFQNVRSYGNGNEAQRTVGTPDEMKAHEAEIRAHAKKLADVLDRTLAIEAKVQPLLEGVEVDDWKHEANRPNIVRNHVGRGVTAEEAKEHNALRKQRLEMERNPPKGAQQALCVTERGPVAPDTFVLGRGSAHAPGDKVEPGFPSVLTTQVPTIPTPAPGAKTCGRRSVLAAWLTNPANPLPARVMANRVWQYHFGRGIVRTPSDFGYRGAPPTHPELLDYLAAQLVEGGWKLKPLHKLIVMSHAYRMATAADPAALAKDPENDLLSHFDLRRLTAEEVRDSVLAVCGNLTDKLGGPSVYPTIPAEVMAGQSRPGSGWAKSTPAEAARRSVYVHQKRSLQVPILVAFDAAEMDNACPVRFVTTQPGQALGMLNSAFLNDQAKVLMESLAKEAGADVRAQVRLALNRVTQRTATDAEVERGVGFVERLQGVHHLSKDEAVRNFCLLALNLNEFVYVN